MHHGRKYVRDHICPKGNMVLCLCHGSPIKFSTNVTFHEGEAQKLMYLVVGQRFSVLCERVRSVSSVLDGEEIHVRTGSGAQQAKER